MKPKQKLSFTNPKTLLKKINHNLDKFDELISQIYEQKTLESLENKLNN